MAAGNRRPIVGRQQPQRLRHRTRRFTRARSMVWASLYFRGAGGVFVRSGDTAPLPILFGFAAPIVVFLLCFSVSRAFRDFVLSIDAVFMTCIQAWRFAGVAFSLCTRKAFCPVYLLGPRAWAISPSRSPRLGWR